MAQEESSLAPAGGKLADRHVTMIALGGSIGAGLFVGSSVAIHMAGPAVLGTYLMTGAMIIVVMRMLGEMLLYRPGTGTFLDCIRFAHGRDATFVAGWLYWSFWAVTIGAEAIAGGIILGQWVRLPVTVLAGALTVLVTLANMLSVRSFGEGEFWLSLVKIAAIMIFALIGCAALVHLLGRPVSPLANISAGHGPLPHGVAAILAAMPTVLFSMVGSEAATVAAAETEDAARNLGRVTRNVGLRLILFCAVSIVLIVSIVPWTEIREGYSPFVTVLEAIARISHTRFWNVRPGYGYA